MFAFEVGLEVVGVGHGRFADGTDGFGHPMLELRPSFLQLLHLGLLLGLRICFGFSTHHPSASFVRPPPSKLRLPRPTPFIHRQVDSERETGVCEVQLSLPTQDLGMEKLHRHKPSLDKCKVLWRERKTPADTRHQCLLCDEWAQHLVGVGDARVEVIQAHRGGSPCIHLQPRGMPAAKRASCLKRSHCA